MRATVAPIRPGVAIVERGVRVASHDDQWKNNAGARPETERARGGMGDA